MRHTELGLRDDEHLLDLLLLLLVLAAGSGLRDKLLEGVGQATVLDRSEVLDGRSSRGEALERLELEGLVGLLRGLKLLPQVLVVELVVVAELEDGEADGRLSEDEHGVGSPFVGVAEGWKKGGELKRRGESLVVKSCAVLLLALSS
jgi:hypothetical protein